MNVAVILAGGGNISDPRYKLEIPKQFTNVSNKPVLVYTLEQFQNHSQIDSIIIVCLSGWQAMALAYSKQFNITKLTDIVEAGADGQASSANASDFLRGKCSDSDIVVLHDSIRPLVSAHLISDSIQVCKEHGIGVAAVCSMDTIIKTKDGKVGTESISRYDIMRIQTPQAYQYGRLRHIHEQALVKGIRGAVDTNTVVSLLGQKIYFSQGSDLNLKINTLEDIEMFRALYAMQGPSIHGERK